MADSQYWTITLCNWKKQPAELFFYKDVVIRNFVIFTEKHQCEILKNIYFEEDLRTADCQLTLWSDCWEVIVSGSHIKLSWLSNITKYQYSVILQNTSRFQIKALNKSLGIYHGPFNHGHHDLTFTLSCEPKFHTFIINGYYTKRNGL